MYTKKCKQCDKEFSTLDYRAKFCSHSCSAIFNNAGRIIKKEKRICLECSKEFYITSHRKIFCSNECSLKHKTNEKIKQFLDGKLTDKQVRRKSIREFLIERQNGVCALCKNEPFHNGKPLIFIVDHIDGVFENNNPENIRAICPNCNSQTDTFSGKNKNRNKTKRHNKRYRD
jgi:hypothetical protein